MLPKCYIIFTLKLNLIVVILQTLIFKIKPNLFYNLQTQTGLSILFFIQTQTERNYSNTLSNLNQT